MLRRALDVSGARIARLEKEASIGGPRQFPSVAFFKEWVSAQGLPLLVAADWSRAEDVQRRAFRSGYHVFYQVTINSVSKGTEFWPVTRIGDEIWTIEPQTNQVTKFYPREWWR